jgi:nucleoid DNA-binding protein
MLKKSINYTQQDLKTAYQIVQTDLFNSLLKAQDGQSIHFAKLGKITKRERQQKCGWDKQNYVYYQLNFKPFTKLKQALNEQIIKKYKLR